MNLKIWRVSRKCQMLKYLSSKKWGEIYMVSTKNIWYLPKIYIWGEIGHLGGGGIVHLVHKMLLNWNNLWSCPFDWNVDRLNAKRSLISYFVDFQTHNALQQSTWILQTRSPSRCCLSMVFVKLICCMFDHFCIRRIDGNYRSATAPLVTASFLL